MNEIFRIGHRGAAGYEPENTLISFKKALELGVDAVELDVYVCKSGQLVVVHDRYVEEKTFEELRSLDAGKGQKIPTLNEVLDLVNNKVIVNIELKGEETAKPVSDIIEKYVTENGWSNDNFIVSSFNHIELKKFKDLQPNIKIGALITGIPVDYAKFGQDLEAYSVNLSMEFINKEFVDDAHKRGLKVCVWTVNDVDDIQRMKNLGVDGMFSNYPDRLK